MVIMLLAAADLFTSTSAHSDYGRLFAAGKPMGIGRWRVSLSPGRIVRQSSRCAADRGGIARPSCRSGSAIRADGPRSTTPSRTSGTACALDRPRITSTPAAEMREVCNTREPYQNLLTAIAWSARPSSWRRVAIARSRCTVSAENSLTASTGIQKSVSSA